MNAPEDIMTPLRQKTLAIVGRPNVGKSSLFNLLTESRKSVVKNRPGVTRDLIFEEAELWGKHYELIDTGGLTEAEDVFSKLIREQVVDFLSTVDALVFMADGRDGICSEDRDVFRLVKETGKPFIVVANKVDKVTELDTAGAEFYEFGQEVAAISVERRMGLEPLLEWIHSQVNEVVQEEYEGFTLSIVGKPNVGKSSLCNKLLGHERVLVSEVAGTTVDAVDIPFEYEGRKYTLIDTAGLRRSHKRTDDVEIISAFKTQKSLKKSELVLLVIDGTIGPTEQDAKILSEIVDAHKGVVLAVNKTDLGEEQIPEFRKTLRQQIADVFHFYQDIPICFISAKTSKGIEKLFETVEHVRAQLHFRIPTKELNEFFTKVIRQAPAPVFGFKNVKFYYITQTKQVPPSFIAFANYPDGVDNGYRRFLTKRIKARWGLEGVPMRIFVMKSRSH